jgi:hypothetical protein
MEPPSSRKDLANITPPTDRLVLLRNKSPDLIKKIALDLDYEEILNLCKVNPGLTFICLDNYFWADKIRHDYPTENISNVPIDKMRYKYLILLGVTLDEKIEEGKQNLKGYNEKLAALNSSLQGLIRRRDKLYRQRKNISIIDSEIQRKEKEIKEFKKEFPNIRKWDNDAYRYFKESYEHFPVKYEDKLITLYLTHNQAGYVNAFLSYPFPYGKELEKYLNDTKLYPGELKPGNLILIYIGDEIQWLIYIYEDRGKLRIQEGNIYNNFIPSKLLQRYSRKEIINKYNLPFIL